MWNPFKKQQKQQAASMDEMLAAALQGMKNASDEADRPYGGTRIGFGANIERRRNTEI